MNMFFNFVKHVNIKKVNNNNFPKFEKKRLWLALLPSIVFVSLFWLVFLLNNTGLFGTDFSQFGILPREISGLKGIFFTPFLHSSYSHILSNTLPILLLIWFLFYFYSKIAFSTFISLWILSGFFTWIIGRGNYHVGASGLVFALTFFLFFRGVFGNSIQLISVSLLVAFLYGSTIWSIFPITELVDESISWEGHFAGALSGLIAAIVLRNKGSQNEVMVWEDEEEEENVNEIIENDEVIGKTLNEIDN